MPHLAAVPHGSIIGRSTETAVLESFVRQSATTGATLLVIGAPGVGESALLHSAARDAQAAGASVLRASGVDFEAGIDFAGVHQPPTAPPARKGGGGLAGTASLTKPTPTDDVSEGRAALRAASER